MSTERIDLDAINELKEMLEDEFVDLVDTYIRDVATKLEFLKSEVDANNADEVRKLAHSMKGASVNLGVLKLSQLCHDLESVAQKGSSSDFETMVIAIQDEADWVMDELEKIKE